MAFRTNKVPVLQEKSASGAVATFNTALAMPLEACNVAVNAWQEGSGDPSPVNNRPIHGFSEVNATRCRRNLCNPNNVALYTVNTSADSRYGVVLKGGHSYTMNSFCTTSEYVYAVMYYSSTGTWSGINPIQNGATSTISPITLNVADGDLLYVYNGRSNGTEASTKAILANVQIEIGTTASDFEPYTGNTYLIQFGQEVYGAEVDVVNGVAHVTYVKEVFNLDDNIGSVSPLGDYNRRIYQLTKKPIVNNSQKCNIAPYLYDYTSQSTHFYCVQQQPSNYRMYLFLPNTVTELTNIEVKYPLAEPFDIQLTPTQIKTLIGNNTIFADTGDIDLTYKDLDIAKRGNFREVFKLPS